ncbi:hypothetical protein BT69DRAFT_1302507 [Atractiella rhizophila]|nr:hypothetical protein BT69DRAFT_1302507 [Atractiella rhizophila]
MSHPAKSFVHLTIRAAAHVNSTHSSTSNSSSSLASSFSSNATDGKVTGFEAFSAAIFEMPFGVRWSNSLMIEQLVADIPLISIGILGLGVGTVWIGLARLNRPLLYILLSTLFSLFGGIIDLGNLLYSQGTSTIRLSSLSITTTLFLAGTTVFRLLYLYRRATQAAVLEKKIIIKTGLEQQSVMRRLSRWSFRPREGEVVLHSASWERFGITGSMIKFTMLAVVVAVGVLEALWRIGFLTDVNKFAVVNRASHGLQIAYLAIFTIKIVESTYTVDHKPRWENYRDAFPVLFGNVIGVANAVPNFPILGFSETPVGRFLSVVQTYIYLIDLVISDVRRPIRDSLSFDPPHPPLLEKIESPKSEDAISVLSLPVPTTETVRSEQTIPVPGPPLRPPRPDEVRVGQDEMGWNGPVIRRSSNIPSWLGPPGPQFYEAESA